jgi:FAD/FMN-containing dehydrogenase
VGAFGSLGVITSVCLKLWPKPPAAATVTVDDLTVTTRVRRPLAVLEQPGSIEVFLWGTPEEVTAATARLGGAARDGHHWPADPVGRYRWSLRLPPALTSEGLRRLPDGWDYLAIHGGALVVVESPGETGDDLDPWGRLPPGMEVQRRLVAQFDPARIINPGRLPGGL